MSLPINQIICGNCLEVIRTFDDNLIDAVVTDPPYGISFMSAKWDYNVPSIEIWQELLRILKPGAHMLVACGTRTQHRMVTNIEDAGFEVRDIIVWAYGSGFPKSLNISKAIDKELGYEREVVGVKSYFREGTTPVTRKATSIMGQGCGINVGQNSNLLTAPSSDLAKQYDGYGTALKPAVELFTLVRKPISESTIAKNVIKWGTGGINIDACRVSVTDREQYQSNSNRNNVNGWWRTASSNVNIRANDLGRFPANLIHDGSQEVLDLFPVTKLPTKQHDANVTNDKSRDNCVQFSKDKHQFNYGKEDSNSASRFFYCAKASPAEKNKGLIETKNIHPTVKPVALMQYLCRLITPANGIVLDPFIGSGTTAIAAINEGFSYIGIELDSNYYEIAKNRVKSNYLEIELFE